MKKHTNLGLFIRSKGAKIMGVQEVPLDQDSFDQLNARGRSYSFGGRFTKNEKVTATCGKNQIEGIIDRVGRNSWVVKKP